MSPAEAALLTAGGTLAVGAAGTFHPRVMLFGPGLWRGPATEAAVALTFDDGPDPVFTPRVARVLKSFGVRATFFCIGAALEAHPDVARELHAAGHELANHTGRHGTFADLFLRQRLAEDLLRCQAQLFALTGKRSPYYRPAVGIRNPAVHGAAWDCGLQVITWTDAARDGLFALTRERAERLADRARPGSILALHDGNLGGRTKLREATLTHLPRLVERLLERGLAPRTLGALLQAKPTLG